MDTEKEVDKLLLDLTPNCGACKECKMRFDVELNKKLGYEDFCPKCLYQFLTNTTYIHQAILQNGGEEFLERLYFNRYKIEFVSIKYATFIDRVHYKIKLTPKE